METQSLRRRQRASLSLLPFCLSFLIFLFVFCTTITTTNSIVQVNGQSTNQTGQPVLSEGFYRVKEGTLLSQYWKVATVEFDVGDDLYFPVVLPCLHCSSERVRKNKKGEPCVCDFTSRGEACGRAPEGCPKDTCAKEDVEKYCRDQRLNPWTELKYSTKDDFEERVTVPSQVLPQDQVKYYRLQAIDPCRQYFIKLNFDFGIADIFFSTSLPEPTQLNLEKYTDFTRYPDRIEVLLCPDDPLLRLGTYFIGVIGRSPNSSFEIEVYSSKTLRDDPRPSESEMAGRNGPCPDDESYYCLEDGASSVVSLETSETRYRYDVEAKEAGDCVTVTFFLQVSTGDGDLFGNWDTPVIDFDGTYQASLQGSDTLLVDRCFDRPGTYSFYISIDAWDPGLYSISASTKNRYFLKRALDLSPYQYGYTATRYLRGDCDLPGGTSVDLSCVDWGFSCQSMWSVYPSSEPDPFWPIPSVWNARDSPFSSALFRSLREHDTPLLSPLRNKLVVVILLENALFGSTKVNLKEDQLRHCSFKSMGTAFNKHRRSLVGHNVRIREASDIEHCNRQKLEKVLNIGRDSVTKLKTEEEFNSLLRLTYQVNTLMFSNTWSACVNYINTFVNTTIEPLPTLTSGCFVSDTTSAEYLNDPCCNTLLLASQCCLPRELEKEQAVFNHVWRSRVEDQCAAGSEDCVQSYLGDYLIVNQNSIKCTSFSSDEYPTLVQDSVDFYRDCKEKFNIDRLALGNQECTSDKDCVFGGVKNKCNKVTNRCICSQQAERATLKCVSDGLTEYTEFFLKEKLGLPGRKHDKQFLDAFEEALKSKQCLNNHGHSTALRHSQIFTTKYPFCGGTLGCTQTTCLDTSCEITPTNCIAICGMNWVPKIKESEEDKEYCEDKRKCNWMGDSCHDDKCREACLKEKPSFCGYCTDDAHCVPIPGVNSRKECEDVEACYLPNGKIELLSAKECRKRQQCSEPCHDGLSCASKVDADNLCTSAEPRDECLGEWNKQLSVCTYPRYSQSLCQAAGLTYHTCTGLSLSECQSCYNNNPFCSVNQTLLQCQVVPRTTCDSKAECQSKGGYCDDADWYKSFGNIDDDFGVCLVPQTYQSFQVQPTCRGSFLTPHGCDPRRYISEEDCNATPTYSFHRLARSKRECQGERGCDNYYQVRSLAPLNSTRCKECGYENVRIFNWRDGYWANSKPIKLKWVESKMESVYEWAPAVNFTRLYELLGLAASETVLADMQSQVLCDFNTRSVPIDVVSCACAAKEEGSGCFQDSDKPLDSGAGRPCIGLGARVQTHQASISISREAVDIESSSSRCVNVFLSSISVFNYQQPQQVAFSPLTKVRDYDTFNIVLNGDGAIVGKVMSDGVEVKLDGELKAYTLCMTLLDDLGKPSSRFNTWDLGVPRSDGKDFLKALELEMVSDQDDTYCFEVKSPAQKQRYFLIARVRDPSGKDGSLYGAEAAAWWTFAVLYTILAICTLLTFLAHYLGFALHFYFLGLFFFLTIMCIVRATYFFLLAAGVFDSDTILAVAYFLIELPTLLYFTAFSCLGAFWIFLLYAHRQSRQHRTVLAVTILFNAMLYLLFVVLIVLYQTLTSSSESTCTGRVAEEEDNTNQQIVSLVYQSFMGGVSLFIALVVAFYGGRLFFGLKKRNFEGRVAVVTIVCAGGLLLHCGFILYLTATLEYDFVVIVLMIALSELLPIAWVTIQFSLLRGLCGAKAKLPSYNRKARFAKALKHLFKTGSSSSSNTGVGVSKLTSTASLASMTKSPSTTTNAASAMAEES